MCKDERRFGDPKRSTIALDGFANRTRACLGFAFINREAVVQRLRRPEGIGSTAEGLEAKETSWRVTDGSHGVHDPQTRIDQGFYAGRSRMQSQATPGTRGNGDECMRGFYSCVRQLNLTIQAPHAAIDEASQCCSYARSDNIVDLLCWSTFSATVRPSSGDVASKTSRSVFAKTWAEGNGAVPKSLDDQALRMRSVDRARQRLNAVP